MFTPAIREEPNREERPVKDEEPVREVDDEVEPLSREMMLKCIARIVEQERQIVEGSAADKANKKIASDIEKTEKLTKEMEAGVAEFRVIQCTPDPCQDKQELAWLIQMKEVFIQQLPNLKPEYISRLLFDSEHKTLALIKNGSVVAGICFRPFPTEGIWEIVFLAVSSCEQIKGYGTILMNFLKECAVKEGYLNLMTYGDKNALRYFGKQGFSAKFDIPKETYEGRLKFYADATLVACQLHPSIRYGSFHQYVKTVMDMHEAMAFLRSNQSNPSHKNPERKASRKNDGKTLKRIPEHAKCPEIEPTDQKDELHKKILLILENLKDNKWSWPFLVPVSDEEAPEYRSIIKYPIDLQTMTERAESKYYINHRLFIADLCRMFDNCYKFNSEETEYYRCGYEMNKLSLKLISSHFPDSKLVPHLPNVPPRIRRK